ncbi:MAG: acyl carrier protein [Humidesulfovibrio sp.]|uniref:acyl carrier protein n=1 Tax=Humidesulfovibrio sp. TaxID=2910988 RepID=UPI0027357E13|nr:acyl carrier protein [Humidesulfovibrio sp.]MDP2849401.1 acyl carrier protein [Humidesulfovibrio sp.]
MAVSVADLRALLEEAGVKPELARSLDPAAPLLRQGVDSVDFPAFCALLEERCALALDEEAVLKLRTLEDFARFLGEASCK